MRAVEWHAKSRQRSQKSKASRMHAAGRKRLPSITAAVSGFTLLEVLLALAAMVLTVSAAFHTLNRANQTAFVNRLYTEAQAVCENQIDAILTKGPFDPTQKPPRIPPELKIGTTIEPMVLVYVDSVSNETVVHGKMTTSIADASATHTINGKTTDLNVRRATVEVRYDHRGKTYRVTMNTLRTADQ